MEEKSTTEYVADSISVGIDTSAQRVVLSYEDKDSAVLVTKLLTADQTHELEGALKRQRHLLMRSLVSKVGP